MQAATSKTTATTDTQADPHPARLSPRMVDVLRLLAQGKTQDQSAQLLGISPSAVKMYITGAKRRLGVKTRSEAIVAAVAGGLVSITGEPNKVRQ